MNILLKVAMVIGIVVLLFGGGGFVLGFLGLVGAAGIGVVVLALPFVGIIFVIIFLAWLIYKFAVTLFKDKKKDEKES
jgi:uncharacterized membrane protein